MSLLTVVHSKIRETLKVLTRPSAVTAAQRKHVRENPACAACGSTLGVQGHHIKPYHKFPGLAADPSNFISLCEYVGGLECHVHLGHGGSFRFYNPHIVADACSFLNASDMVRAAIVTRAKMCREIDG